MCRDDWTQKALSLSSVFTRHEPHNTGQSTPCRAGSVLCLTPIVTPVSKEVWEQVGGGGGGGGWFSTARTSLLYVNLCFRLKEKGPETTAQKVLPPGPQKPGFARGSVRGRAGTFPGEPSCQAGSGWHLLTSSQSPYPPRRLYLSRTHTCYLFPLCFCCLVPVRENNSGSQLGHIIILFRLSLDVTSPHEGSGLHSCLNKTMIISISLFLLPLLLVIVVIVVG